MIAFDLKCAKGHVFEAWFASGAGYEHDVKAGRVECPLCGNQKIEKAPMAPNVLANSKSGKAPAPSSEPSAEQAARMAETFKMLRKVQERIERDFDHVGDRFAEEARKIHHGEVEKRSIYGNATPDEAGELHDEGIEFGQMPWLPRHNS